MPIFINEYYCVATALRAVFPGRRRTEARPTGPWLHMADEIMTQNKRTPAGIPASESTENHPAKINLGILHARFHAGQARPRGLQLNVISRAQLCAMTFHQLDPLREMRADIDANLRERVARRWGDGVLQMLRDRVRV